MNYLDIEVAIINTIAVKSNLIIPKPTTLFKKLAFECDLFVLNNNKTAIGYDIKSNEIELKEESLKNHIMALRHSENAIGHINKYYGKFNKFYYVVPLELKEIALNIVPEFIGIYLFEKKEYPLSNELVLERRSINLGNYKWSDKDYIKIAKFGCDKVVGLKRELVKTKNLP